MFNFPPEIHHLIIGNLAQPLAGPDDPSSKSALLQCMTVSREFYANARTILFSRCRLTIREQDLEDGESTLVDRFVKFILDKPAALDLQPLISTVRSLEVVVLLTEGSRFISTVGETINAAPFVSLLQAFLERDAPMDCLLLNIISDKDVKLDWSSHLASEEGRFADVFEQLNKTKVRRLCLQGIRNIPNTLILKFTSVKHLILNRVVILDGRKLALEDPLFGANIESVFNPVSLDLELTTIDTKDYRHAIFHFFFPGSILHLRDNEYTQPRFPHLREFRLNWSVTKGLDLLRAVYQNAPYLEVVHAISPHFYHDSGPPYPGWSSLRPPTTLRSFSLIGFIVIEEHYDTIPDTVRWPNLCAFLGTITDLPNMTHIDIKIQFTRSASAAQRYWIFEHPVAQPMWGNIAAILASCIAVKDLRVEIVLGKEFDPERVLRSRPEDAPPPRGEQETALVETCLYEAFKPMFAAKPSAKFKIQFVR